MKKKLTGKEMITQMNKLTKKLSVVDACKKLKIKPKNWYSIKSRAKKSGGPKKSKAKAKSNRSKAQKKRLAKESPSSGQSAAKRAEMYRSLLNASKE